MYSIRQLPEFTAWLRGIKDKPTQIRLARRLDKVQRGEILIVMLGGGDKSTQAADIAQATKLAATIKE